MDWIQVLSIIGSLLAAIFYIHSDSKDFRKDFRQDMKQQAARTDKLYEMFVDLLKNKK